MAEQGAGDGHVTASGMPPPVRKGTCVWRVFQDGQGVCCWGRPALGSAQVQHSHRSLISIGSSAHRVLFALRHDQYAGAAALEVNCGPTSKPVLARWLPKGKLKGRALVGCY